MSTKVCGESAGSFVKLSLLFHDSFPSILAKHSWTKQLEKPYPAGEMGNPVCDRDLAELSVMVRTAAPQAQASVREVTLTANTRLYLR